MKVKALRENRGLTQEFLARQAGISRSFLCELETGTKKPSYDTLIKLAAALGVRVSELIDESEGRPEARIG